MCQHFPRRTILTTHFFFCVSAHFQTMWQEQAKRYTIEKSKTIHAEAFEKKKDLDPTKGLATAQMASRLYILVRPTPPVIRFWFIYAALCCSLSHHWHNLMANVYVWCRSVPITARIHTINLDCGNKRDAYCFRCNDGFAGRILIWEQFVSCLCKYRLRSYRSLCVIALPTYFGDGYGCQ